VVVTAVKMEAILSSETLVPSFKTTIDSNVPRQ
jgi:hypothetical protein